MIQTAEKPKFQTRLYYKTLITYYMVDGTKLDRREMHPQRSNQPLEINPRLIEAELYLRGLGSAKIQIMESTEFGGWVVVKEIDVISPVQAAPAVTVDTRWAGDNEKFYDCTKIHEPVIRDRTQERWY